ncbi:hypothetical protein ABZZ79_00205 [Streptomyces sp. NPDC006458]|uniref:hypothetical protein n=1 Tax=Streptomyces sp. NPDC006458 TaxID=3154302 RepID=UPI0033ADF0EF
MAASSICRRSPGDRPWARAVVSVCLVVLAFAALLGSRTATESGSGVTPLSLSRAALRVCALPLHGLPGTNP